MKTWIASDLHFSHKNALQYFPARHQFANMQQMNSEIISRWNSVVQPGDRVYLLGDVAFCDANTAVELLEQLNGNKILVAGNHDTRLLQSPKFHSVFESAHQYLVFMRLRALFLGDGKEIISTELRPDRAVIVYDKVTRKSSKKPGPIWVLVTGQVELWHHSNIRRTDQQTKASGWLLF